MGTRCWGEAPWGEGDGGPERLEGVCKGPHGQNAASLSNPSLEGKRFLELGKEEDFHPELESLDGDLDPGLPSTEDVILKTEQVTKNIQELLRAAQEFKHDRYGGGGGSHGLGGCRGRGRDQCPAGPGPFPHLPFHPPAQLCALLREDPSGCD